MRIRKSLAIWPVLAGTAVAATLGSCSASRTELPGSTKLPEKVLSKNEVQSAVGAMIVRGKTHQGETAKRIETSQ